MKGSIEMPPSRRVEPLADIVGLSQWASRLVVDLAWARPGPQKAEEVEEAFVSLCRVGRDPVILAYLVAECGKSLRRQLWVRQRRASSREWAWILAWPREQAGALFKRLPKRIHQMAADAAGVTLPELRAVLGEGRSPRRPKQKLDFGAEKVLKAWVHVTGPSRGADKAIRVLLDRIYLIACRPLGKVRVPSTRKSTFSERTAL
jgi:hypothetical protein